MFDDETGRLAGWAIDVGCPTVQLTHAGYHRDANDERRHALCFAIAETFIQVASPTWDPPRQ